MGLTAEQLVQRQRTIGASEIAAIAGVSRFKGAVDVFATKARGPNGEVPPMVTEPPPEPDVPLAVAGTLSTDPREIGHIFEDALLGAYATRTGHEVEEWQDSLVHPENAWASCTPDGRVAVANDNDDEEPDRGGLELKMVGRWVREDWPGDGLPEYVVCQCQWSMWITGHQWWDVCALIDGTQLRIVRVERDDGLISDLVELGEAFWREHILADVMPPVTDGAQAMKVMAQHWRQDNGETLELTGEDADKVEAVARELLLAQQREKDAASEVGRLKALLCAATGEHKALKGGWGRWAWPTMQGNPTWKAIAEELAGGVVPQALIDANRGDSYRRGQLYASKALKAELLG